MGTPNVIEQYIEPEVLSDIERERTHQIYVKGFNQAHDDELMPHQWVDIIKAQLWQIENAKSPEAFRKYLVKIAAVAAAGIEAADRAVY